VSGAGQGAAVRAAAARSVAQVLRGQTLEQALTNHVGSVVKRDQALLRELSAGCLRYLPRLEAVLDLLLARPLRKRDQDLKALALIGLYQLTHLRIPPHAAVSATVDAADLLKRKSARGLLNAVLRRYQREHAALESGLPEAAAQAHPTWLWALLGEHWPAQRLGIAAANNGRPPMTLRVNMCKTTREAYLARLEGAAITARAGTVAPEAVILDEAVDVDRLPDFAAGRCSVQDESAQLAATFLAPGRGDTVLDACAAPGGKTGHLLELYPAIDLTAMDISAERLSRVQANLQRLGHEARLLVGDITAPPQDLENTFDAILADVPCSATGVIRRHPDIKSLRRPGDIAAFAEQQAAILEALWSRLRPGGRLLYVTCSILPAENQDVVRAFLDRQQDAQELNLDHPAGISCAPGIQFLPDTDGGDGLYFALLTRVPPVKA